MRSSALALIAVAVGLPLAASGATTSDSCSSVAACVLGTQASTGIGVNGVSAKGFGVEGATSVAATTAGTARAGVFGKDTTNSSKEIYNSGVAGTSTYGAGGSFTSVKGLALYAGGGFEVLTQAALNPQSATNGPAVVAFGEVDSPDLARRANVRPQIGEDGEDVFQGVGCYITPDHETSNYCGESSYINASGNAAFENVTAQSFIVGTGTGLQLKGAKVASYAARSASPTIEDFGSATLRNGVASVMLDKTFRSAISPGYMVFVTPHGDSNSLYTTNSDGGFVVRESKGGRSTLAFDYRIVAKPMDAKAAHLPLLKASSIGERVALKRMVK